MNLRWLAFAGLLLATNAKAVPSYVNASTVAGGTNTSVTLTLPGSRVNGNILFVALFVGSPSTPSGWTKDATIGGLTIWHRYVDGTETNPTFNFSAASYVGTTYQYTGVVASNPIGASSTNNQGSGSTQTGTAITSLSGNSLALAFCYDNGGTNGGSGATGWTQRNWQSTLGTGLQVQDKSIGAQGSSSGSITITGNSFGGADTIVLELKSQAPTNGASMIPLTGAY